MRFLKPVLCLLAVTLGTAQAATYYVSPSGNDSRTGTSLSLSWATFSRAFSAMRAGDTLMVDDGVYYQQMASSFSGTSSSPVTVRAINDGKAIIDGDTNGDGVGDLNNGPMLYLRHSYWVVEGLVFNHGGRDCPGSGSGACYYTGDLVRIEGTDHVTLRRISAFNANADINSTVIRIVVSNDSLIEDCVAAGTGRKMMSIFGADGTAAKRNIIRRCFSAWQRWDGRGFNPGFWTWGDGIESYNASNNIFENVINYGMTPGPSPGVTIFSQSGMTTTGVAVLGAMSVRSGMKWNGTAMSWPCPNPYVPSMSCPDLVGWKMRGGFRLGNSDGSPVYNNLFQDIFSWGNAGKGFVADLTVGGNTKNQLVRATVLNSGLASGVNGVSMETSDRTNFFNNWTNNYVTGVDTTGTGARLIYRYQSTFSGDTPVPTLSSTPLWPWPMESRIQSELGTYISAADKAVNPEVQNFSVTSTMQGIFNSVPAAVNPLGTSSSDTTAPSVPTGLAASAASPSQVNLTWTAATDNVAVAGYRVYKSGNQVGTSVSTSYSDSTCGASTTCSYTVAAYDIAGNVSGQSTSASATTPSVPAGDTTPPSVSITAPAGGSSASGTLTISANAADNVGVAGVQFKVDGTPIGGEDTSSPYSIAYDTSGASNGAHTLTAVARDAAGNTTTSGSVSITVTNAAAGPLSISSITDNRTSYANSQIPKFSKLELTFQINNTVATNFQMPYDANPPAGISPSTYPMHKGISVDAVFSNDNWATSFSQPAFFYQVYDDQVKVSWDGDTHEWHLPTTTAWKARFAPNQTGSWQYKIVARDASGTTQSATSSFTVAAPNTHGPIKVSATDKRYFEYADGTPFIPAGINIASNIADPVLSNQANYAALSQNGINLLRVWISNIYGSAWLEWLGGRNIYDGYLPRPGLEAFHNPVTGKDQLTQVLMYDSAGTGWYDSCRFQFWDDSAAVKPNTNYKLVIKYFGQGITGPRVAGNNNFGLVGKMSTGWYPNCQDPGTATVITNYGQNTSDVTSLTGTWNSGSNSFIPKIYLGLENVTAGKVYIDSVSLREDLGNGQFGPEVISEPSMQYDLYIPQEPSYSLDKLVALAESSGIYLKLVMSDLNDMIYYKQNDDGTYAFTADNQDGFYGQGRTVNKTRWLQQAWWRYAQARWGYSNNIHSWELTNEGDPYLTTHWQQTDEFGKYMHCEVFGVAVNNVDSAPCNLDHPNRHLTTTSFWTDFPGYDPQSGQGFWGNPKYPNVDYADVHAYISTSQAPLTERTAMQSDSAYYHLFHSGQYGSWKLPMPIVRGEGGMDLATQHATTIPGLRNDMPGQWYHDFVWSGVDSGGLYEMYWWYTPDILNGNVYDHRPSQLSVTNFMAGIPLSNGKYQDLSATISNSALRVAGQKDLTAKKAHLWVQNTGHTWLNVLNLLSILPQSGTITIPGFTANQSYSVEWWDTYRTSSQVTGTTTVTAGSNGNLVVPITLLLSDVAMKISPTGQSSTNQAPVVSAGPDVTAVTGSARSITGTASDDGLPVNNLSLTWSKVSGPGTVTFGSPNAAVTTATFSASGSYVIRLTGTDSALTSSDDATVVVSASDTTPPVLSSITAGSLTNTGATITWTTNEAADQQVDYGLTTSYGLSTALGTSLTTSHSMAITGLSAGSTYHYRVKSRDGAGNLQTSGDAVFTTTGTASLAPPNNVASTPSLAPPSGWNACDLTQDQTVNIVDVQLVVNMSLGTLPCSASINGVNSCSIVTVQRVVNATLGQGCSTDAMNGPRTATLTWAPPGGSGLAGYNIYRASNLAGPYTKVNLALITGTTFSDTTVASGQTYFYVVTSVDGSGNQSANSNQTQALIP
ncbi:MAG: Ig-like domain-containing protein [Acidobacteriota bacterium]